MGDSDLESKEIPFYPQIEFARAKDIPEIVTLHRSTMSYSINSRLGINHLSYIYQRTISHPGSLVKIARFNHRLVGVVSATLSVSHLKDWLKSEISISEWMKYLKEISAHPTLWAPLLQSITTNGPIHWRGETVDACLTALTTAPDARHAGIGRLLVLEVDNFMSHQNQKMYWLDTLTTNVGARAFYTRLGFINMGNRGQCTIFLRRLKN